MGFFRQIKDSFTNFESYREFAFQKKGKTFKYFILLFTLTFLIGGLRFVFDFNAGAAGVRETVEQQVPEFRLENGELFVSGEQPIILGDDGHTVMIIDTTGQTQESALNNYAEGVLVFRDRLITKQNYQQRVILFTEFKEISFDKQDVIGLLPMLKWLLVLIAVFAYVFKSVWVLITVLILALIGMIFNSNDKSGLKFENLLNMAVYAFTLPWLVEMLKNLAYPALPMFWVIKWGLAVYILYRGIKAVAAKPPVLNEEPPDSSGDIVI